MRPSNGTTISEDTFYVLLLAVACLSLGVGFGFGLIFDFLVTP